MSLKKWMFVRFQLTFFLAGIFFFPIAKAADSQPTESLIPPNVWPHIDDENKKKCAELAYATIKKSGRTYRYATTSKDQHVKKDIWIGETHFLIDRSYIVRVNYGSGWLTEVPGIHIWLQAVMPDLVPMVNQTENELDVQIKLSCQSLKNVDSQRSPVTFETSNLQKKFTYPHPEIGLIGESRFDSPTATVTYFPADQERKNLNGLPLKFICDRRYPFLNIRNQKSKSYCSSSFMLNNHVNVVYSFQISQLPQWALLDEKVNSLVQSFLVKGD